MAEVVRRSEILSSIYIGTGRVLGRGISMQDLMQSHPPYTASSCLTECRTHEQRAGAPLVNHDCHRPHRGTRVAMLSVICSTYLSDLHDLMTDRPIGPQRGRKRARNSTYVVSQTRGCFECNVCSPLDEEASFKANFLSSQT